METRCYCSPVEERLLWRRDVWEGNEGEGFDGYGVDWSGLESVEHFLGFFFFFRWLCHCVNCMSVGGSQSDLSE